MIGFLCAVVALFVLVYWHVAIGAVVVAVAAWWAAALVVGAPAFWVLIAVEVGFLVYALDNDDDTSFPAATVSVLIVLGLLQLTGSVPVFSYVWAHPLFAATVLAGYFVIGAAWSVTKWWFAETAKFRRVRDAFAQRFPGPATIETQAAWAKRVKEVKTDPNEHKATFMAWIAYWPISLTWTILNDPLKRLVRRIYLELQGVYQRITDHVWGTV